MVAGSSSSSSSSQAAAAARRDVRPLAPAQLTIGEQRERAELRVDRDKLKINNLEQRLKEDEQRLTELKRMEAERGGSSEAVKMIFPQS